MGRWWIDKGRVMGSSNPETAELEELYRQGFRTIVSLIEEGVECPHYDAEEVRAIGFKLHSIPVRDFGAPTTEQFDEFLRIVKQTLSSEKILVHCMGGCGRTGTMGAAYWIDRGLSADEAIKKIREANPVAIESMEQKNSLHKLEAHLKSKKKE